MPQISPADYHALPLRVHTLLTDIPLHDVWAVDLSARRPGVTLSEFLQRANERKSKTPDAPLNGLPLFARALFRLRIFLGRLLHLDAEPRDAAANSFANRLTAEDRTRSSVAPGTSVGMFRAVYQFENEHLLEIQNSTVHAATLTALTETPGSYRLYFAVYVCPRSWITPCYMALIDPFRIWIIYPALLNKIRATWDQTI
jgi:hypothetical protein